MQPLFDFLAAHHHVALYLGQIVRALFWLVVLMAVFVPLEYFFSAQPEHNTFHKGWLTNLGWYFINSLTPIFILGPPAALLAWAVHAVPSGKLHGRDSLPAAMGADGPRHAGWRDRLLLGPSLEP